MTARALAIVFTLAVTAAAAAAQPTAGHPIDDRAAVLAESDEAALVEKLRGLRERGVDVAVVLVQTTGGIAIERYARDVAERWHADRTSAAVLVLAIGDRKSRLEVNDTLRPRFPDRRAQGILDNARGYLRSGDYAGAVGAIIDEVDAAARGDAPDLESPHPQSGTSPPARTDDPPYEQPTLGDEPERRTDSTWLYIVLGLAGLLGAGAIYAAASRSASGTFSHDGYKIQRSFVADWLLCTMKIIGFLAMIVLIVAASRGSSSSSSSGWSSSTFRGGGGGRSSGGGWSGGGASSSW